MRKSCYQKFVLLGTIFGILSFSDILAANLSNQRTLLQALTIRPIIGVGIGSGFAEDDAAVQVKISGQPITNVDADGVGAHGLLYKGDVGIDAQLYHYYAGIRLTYQKSNIHQSLKIFIPSTQNEIRVLGGLYSSTILTGRFGYSIFDDRVTGFLIGGYVWSKAESEVYNQGSKVSEDTLRQYGPLFGLGVAVALHQHWLLEMTYNYVDYRKTDLPTALDTIQRTKVKSLNTATYLTLVYRF